MNIYQHLFILIPMLWLVIYGLWGYGTTNKLYCALVGLLLGISYLGYLVFSMLALVFNFLGSL
jgi:hypothetical protein